MKVGRDVTDEQRSRRPIFIATLWAAASWLFFPRCSLLTSRTICALGREAQISRTAKMVRDARRYRQSGSDRFEKQPTDLRRKTCYFGDRTLARERPTVARLIITF
jgi:hypothetical protein